MRGQSSSDLGPATGRVVETLGHDWQYRRTTQTVEGPGPTTLLDLTYGYDEGGNLTSVTDATGNRDATYGYDDLSRLTSVTWPDGNRSWQYDLIGNVTSLQVDTGLAGEGELTYSYALNGSNENAPILTGLASTQGGSPLWSASVASDAIGNVTSDQASTYAYDLRNHLGSRQVGATTSQHAFTADGRLARLETGAPADVILDPAGRRMAKRENGLWRDYVYLGGRLVAYFDEGSSEAVLVISDHIGMPMMAVDGTGAVVWQAKAEPYGQLRGTVNRPFDPGLRYPGQWQDELTVDGACVGGTCTMPGPLERSFSLFENGYRWYRPDWGRYTQADPINPQLTALAESHVMVMPPNSHGYVSANPGRFVDPFGLESPAQCQVRWTVAGGATGGVAGGVVGGLAGGAGGTLVAPGFGTVGGAMGGVEAGVGVGSIIGAGVGSLIGLVVCECEKQDDSRGCRPCIPPVGTLAYRPLDTPSKPQHGIDGPHYNMYEMHQSPYPACICFWHRLKAIPPPLPPEAIPIVPAAGGGPL
jgi:RHS repeat-associated protein